MTAERSNSPAKWRSVGRRDLGLQLLAIYLLFVLPIMLAALAFDIIGGERLQADVRAADLALARAVALETEAKLSDAIYTVQQMASNPVVQSADQSGMLQYFEDISNARPDVNLIYRLGPDGIMLFHYPVGPGSTVGVDFSFRDYFQDARRASGPVISKGRISPTTSEPVTTAVMPLRGEDGGFMGVVATNIRLQSLSDTLNAIAAENPLGQEYQISIIDSTGQIIADRDPERLLRVMSDDSPQLVRDVLLGKEGTRVFHDIDEQEWLSSFIPIPSGGWGVIVQRPTAIAFATANAFHRGLLLAIGIILIGGVLFWLALSRRVIQPLVLLTRFSQAIGGSADAKQEDVTALQRVSERHDQMGSLVRGLQRMEQSIQERLTELATLVDTSKAVIASLEPDIVLNQIVEQTSRLTGADTCAIVALKGSENEFRIRASRGLSANYINRLRIDPAEPNSPSMRAIRTRHPIKVEDTEVDPTFHLFRPRARAEGYRALLAVPLLTQHAPPAALLVYYREPHTFSEREVSLVWNFANHAAMAIENAELYARSDEQLQKQSRRLESLYESMADGVILEDLSGKVLFCNKSMWKMLDLQPEAGNGIDASEIRAHLLRGVKNADEINKSIESALSANGPQSVEWDLERQGRRIDMRLQTFLVTDSDGKLIGRGQFFQDITRDRDLDRMKNSLIATVSHELRTPLAAIKGYATTLLAKDVEWDPSAQEEFLTIISQETDRLSNLVTDLLDLSRIESGSLVVERSTCLVQDLVGRALQTAHPGPNLPPALEIDARLPALHVDARKIEAVLRNLIENAVKYAGSGTPLTISAVRENNSVLISVCDDGPGIPAEFSDHIFTPFFRVEDGLKRDRSGAGLGLSICQGFVRAHGGEIWLEPRRKGTRITFSLPLEAEVSHA
jgi:PAS domain S-box-containing protein